MVKVQFLNLHVGLNNTMIINDFFHQKKNLILLITMQQAIESLMEFCKKRRSNIKSYNI